MTTKASERFEFLDSLRGVAALIVVITHCFMINSNEFRNEHHNIAIAFSSVQNFALFILARLQEGGRSCVVIFFVLSGFVLAYSMMAKPTGYVPYAVKRFFRIYPVFFVTVAVSYLLHLTLGGEYLREPGWLDKVINPDLSFKSLLYHFALAGTEGDIDLDGPMWSLVHEMRISLIFPFVLWTVIRFREASVIGWLLFSVGCSTVYLHLNHTVVDGYRAPSVPMSFINSGYFIVFFAVGAYMSIYRTALLAFARKVPAIIQCLALVAGIMMAIKGDADQHFITASLIDYGRGLGATLLILCGFSLPIYRKILDHRVCRWLGRVSYSLYLVHVLLIYIATQTFGREWAALPIAFVVIPLSLVLAEVMVRTLESPSIRAGQWSSARV